MADSYNDILSRMTNKYTELTGIEPDNASDTAIRLKLLAGEIFSLSNEIAVARNMMFIKTASGDKLDLHADQYGISRNRGCKAHGQIMFTLDTPLEYDITIPRGTICTVADGSLRYVTTEEKTIERAGSFILVNAEAQNTGRQYNVSSRSVNTIVTYFSVGIGITNSTSFSGGTDDESDEELRKRLTEYLQNKPNGMNSEYFSALATSVEGIASAVVVRDENNTGFRVYLGGRGGSVDVGAFQEARDLIQENRPVGVAVTVVRALPLEIDLSISIAEKDGYLYSAVRDKTETAIRDLFYSFEPGTTLTGAEIGSAVFSVEGVSNYSLNGFTDRTVPVTQIPVLGTLTINSLV